MFIFLVLSLFMQYEYNSLFRNKMLILFNFLLLDRKTMFSTLRKKIAKKLFLRPHQQKLQSLIGKSEDTKSAEEAKKQNICYLFYLFSKVIKRISVRNALLESCDL